MPNPATFPFKRFTAELTDGTVLEISGAQQLSEALQYSPTPGLPRLVAHLRDLQLKEHNPPSAEVRLCVTTGSADALGKAFEMLIAPGDNVLVDNPTYSGSLAFLNPLGANLVGVPTEGGAFPSKLRSILESWDVARGPRPKILYTIPTGSNPTGQSLSEQQKKQVYAVAQDYDLLILEDDPYYYVQFLEPGQKRTRSMFSMDIDGRVIRFDSFSKLLSAGIRVGFATGPAPLIERIELHTQAANLHTSGLSQAWVAALFDNWASMNDGNAHAGFICHVNAVSDFYRERRDAFEASAKRHLNGLATWEKTQGGMFAWLKLEGVIDTWPLIKDKAVDKKVLFVPGQSFTIPTTAPSQYVRAAFSTATHEEIDEALRRLAELVREHHDDVSKVAPAVPGSEVVKARGDRAPARVGLLGYGSLGRFLAKEIQAAPDLELAFVWNRSADRVREAIAAGELPEGCLIESLEDGLACEHVDVVAEVCHPQVAKDACSAVLPHAHLYVGSPTAFADDTWLNGVQVNLLSSQTSVFLPVGALWGAWDIQRLSACGALKKLRVTMKFHPDALKLQPPLSEKLAQYEPAKEFVVFEGSVRELAPLAPNNVNTMACAAIAAGKAHGLDGVEACLVADDRLEAHVIIIEAEGPNGFKVETRRTNPAAAKAVTGQLTYASFFASLRQAAEICCHVSPGIHLC